MSAAEESRMRKRICGSDGHAFTGAFTRRKSEVFVHRTRSGRCRPDPTPHPSRHQPDLTGFRLLTKKPRTTTRTQDHQFSDEATFPPFLVKDLRARRVTSASVKEEDDGVARKAKVPDEADSLIRSCLEDVKKLVGGFHPEKQHPDGGGSREQKVAGESMDAGSLLVSKGLEALGAEDSSSPQSTPPDPEICAAKMDSEKIKEAQIESGDPIPGKTLPTKEIPGKKVCRRVLSQCSRVKLFKAPNSVSYKRMLPYLMVIAKEYPDASGKCGNLKSEESLVQCSVGGKLLEDSKKDCRFSKNGNGEVPFNSPVGDEPSSMMNADGNAMKYEDDMSCQGLVESKSSQDPSLIMADCPLEKHNLAEVGRDETKLQIGSQAELATTSVPNMQDSKCSLRSQECHSCADGVARKCFDETNLCQTEGTQSSLQHSLAAQHLHHTEPSSDIKGSSDRKEVVGDHQVSDQVVNVECCVQTKRPDIVRETQDNASRGSRPVSSIHGANTVTRNGSGNSQDTYACSTGARPESCTIGKQVLKSGRRKRLFQIPGSINYKRMLYALTAAGSSGDGQFEEVKMSINGKPSSPSGNKTGSSNIGSGGRKMVDQGPGQMSDNEKPQPPGFHIDSSNISLKRLETIDQCPSQISDTDPSPLGLHADSSKIIPVCVETIDQDQIQMSGTEKPPSPLGHHVGSKNIIPVGLETINQVLKCNEPPSPHIFNLQKDLDSKQAQESTPELIESNIPGTNDSNNGGRAPVSAFSSPINSTLVVSSCITKEDGGGTASQAQPTEAGSCLVKTVPSDTKVPAAFLRKGILRQNPRGCRGLCTCLNCSSFRLHAERAFVFSRNQMLDAEEVALDLMKELAHIRAMLQKSSAGTDGQAVICLNQVKEACMKCSEAENIAKQRLSQMNNELHIHCQVPYEHGARVRFANKVELVTPSADIENTR